MAIKPLVQALVTSAYRATFPTSESVSVQVKGGSGSRHVAPHDGYVSCVVSNTPNVDFINISVEGRGVSSAVPTYAGAWGSTWIPVRKGETVIVNITGSGSPTLQFTKSGLST